MRSRRSSSFRGCSLRAQAVLLWWPVRGTVQAIAAGWYAQGVWTLWLAPLALAGAYYIVPKIAGRVLPTYESAPLGFLDADLRRLRGRAAAT